MLVASSTGENFSGAWVRENFASFGCCFVLVLRDFDGLVFMNVNSLQQRLS